MPNDTLEFKAGNGISISANSNEQHITIATNNVVNDANSIAADKSISAQALKNGILDFSLTLKGQLPPGDVNTGAYWRGVKTGIWGHVNSPQIVNALSGYADILVIGTRFDNTEKTILWVVKGTGPIYIAGINSNVTAVTWNRIAYVNQLKPAFNKIKVGDTILQATL